MDRRRIVLGLAGLGCCAFLSVARAQQAAKIPRVAILTFGSPANARARSEAFRKGMRELGYVEGANVLYEWRSANGQPDLLRSLALELSRREVDVVVTASTLTTEAMVLATGSIPIVMALVEDPVASGFVHSLARPESNVTGLTTNVLEQVPKFLELLAGAVPGLAKAAALMNPTSPIYKAYRARLEAAARPSRVRIVVLDVTNLADIDAAFRKAESEHAGGLVVMSDTVFYNERASIAELATEYRLPGIYPHPGFSDAGGLMSYAPNIDNTYFRVAAYVDKLLKGAKPADLPVEQPGHYELIVNQKAARAIGLTIPQQLLRRADKVIG